MPVAHPDKLRRQPRGFVRASGIVFQAAGGILLLSGCCIGSLSGLLLRAQDILPLTAREWFLDSPPGQVLTALNVVFSAGAGLALLVFGLGLQHERRGSATGALITAATLALLWWLTLLAAIIWAPSVVRILVALLLVLLATALFLLAGAARRENRLHPPPPDEPVIPEFLEQFKRRRHPVEHDDD